MLRFAVPVMLTSILQQLYALADSMIAGRILDIDAFTAVGAAILLIARYRYLNQKSRKTKELHHEH